MMMMNVFIVFYMVLRFRTGLVRLGLRMMRMRMMGDVVGTLLPAMMKGSISLNEQSALMMD